MKKAKKFFGWVMLIAIIVFLGYTYLTKESTIRFTNDTATSSESVVVKGDDGIESIMSRKDFQEKIKLQAETVLLTEQKTAEEKRHTEEMDRIEKRLEQLRGKELSFQ